MRHAAIASLVLSILALTASSSGQDPGLVRLRAAVAAAPDDASARCSLAFALVREGDGAGAVTEASVAISALGSRSDRGSRRLLGVCLYNRGRARELLGDRPAALRDYFSSLRARPNDTVEARLRGLDPDASPDAPIAALVAALIPHFEVPFEAAVTEGRTRGGVSVSLVPSERGASPSIAAVASLCGQTVLTEVDEGFFDNYGSLGVDSVQSRQLGDLDALVVQITGAGDATCGTMDGAMDFEHTSSAVLFVDGCTLRLATFVTHRDRCEGSPEGMRVTFDRAGRVTRAARAGHTLTEEAGTFAIRDLSHSAE